MSYAPIQSETMPNIQNAVETKTPIPRTKSSRNSSQSQRRVAHRRRNESHDGDGSYPIIVHCHLCWDWVWQRPQQFLSRLSQHHKILFVETAGPEPELATPSAKFRQAPGFPNITILRLAFPKWKWNDAEYVDSERRRLVQDFVDSPIGKVFENPIQWFYDPMAVPSFAGHMGEVLTVYDCMDELSKFRGAPPQMIDRELQLLERADIVFTGGRRLYESKSQFHDNCHFYGCGVDVEHFGKARSAQTIVPADVGSLSQPVLGYFGVIDERMDYELVAHLAETRPSWSIVMVGPVTKVAPDQLPQAPNLHWLGQRTYADLPAFCKGFDLCLMPFALNESTEYINPTKALEYMATGRQIIGTPVTDVVRNFGSVVKIARTREDFVLLCESALDQPDADAIARGLKMAQQNSWDSIVAELEGHMVEALQRKHIAA